MNKCENVARADEQAADFWELGHQPIAISAISGTGTGDLMDALMEVSSQINPHAQLEISIVIER